MKTISKLSQTAKMITAVCFAAVLSTTAVRADYTFYGSSKHGTTAVRTTVENPYDKFAWLTPADNAGVTVNRIVVSLTDQRLYAYDGQRLVAWSNVSSGRPGYGTPTGDFTVTQKDPDHHSNLYENAPMPFYMRLTDGGVGLHAGILPGYPCSHGCVHVPYAMAEELYQRVADGTQVEIISGSLASTQTAGVSFAQD